MSPGPLRGLPSSSAQQLKSALLRRPLLSAAALTALGVGALGLVSLTAGDAPITSARFTLHYAFPLAVAGALLWTVNPTALTRPASSGFRTALVSGWAIPLTSLLTLGLGVLGLPAAATPPATEAVLWFVCGTLATATFEEWLCRGTILPLLAHRPGPGTAGATGPGPSAGCPSTLPERPAAPDPQAGWQATLLSAGLFAAMHLANLTHTSDLLGTAAQVGYTFCLGALLGTLYLLSRNIWAVIVLHAAFNFFGSVTELWHPATGSAGGTTPLGAALLLLLFAPLLLAARRVYWRQVAG